MKRIFKVLPLVAVTALLSTGALAQQIILKVHHFLPAASTQQKKVIEPWCERINKDSKDRLKCQIYPSMQLGGTPPQLVNQVRDGVVDVIFTLPGYTPGRFPIAEVFELPFMMEDPEATSKALWDYVAKYGAKEFSDYKLLSLNVHGPGVFHMVKTPITSLDDLKGMKVRAPTRQTNKMLAALGATPVAMPVPQVGEALSKSVIDGALVPYEVVPAVKIQELVKHHSETDPSEPAIYCAEFMFAMNKAKYQSLPADLKAVIDRNSGKAFSGEAGKAFDLADEAGKKTTLKNAHNVIPANELRRFKAASQSVSEGWIKEMNAKGENGQKLLEAAKDLIAANSKK
jgi:TRAP-type C4-dicarboxylate transport system substrate-binding protein